MLGGGKATLVTPVVPIPDSGTLAVMKAYYEGLVVGLSPAEALARIAGAKWTRRPGRHEGGAGSICLGAVTCRSHSAQVPIADRKQQ